MKIESARRGKRIADCSGGGRGCPEGVFTVGLAGEGGLAEDRVYFTFKLRCFEIASVERNWGQWK